MRNWIHTFFLIIECFLTKDSKFCVKYEIIREQIYKFYEKDKKFCVKIIFIHLFFRFYATSFCFLHVFL